MRFPVSRTARSVLATARAAMWLAQLSYEDETDKQDKILRAMGLKRMASYIRPCPASLPMPSTGGLRRA